MLNKEEKSDNAEMTLKVVMKRKSPKKRENTEDVKLKEEKKTNDNVKIEGAAYLSVILETFVLMNESIYACPRENLTNKIEK